jgi:hypothetical protein
MVFLKFRLASLEVPPEDGGNITTHSYRVHQCNEAILQHIATVYTSVMRQYYNT